MIAEALPTEATASIEDVVDDVMALAPDTPIGPRERRQRKVFIEATLRPWEHDYPAQAQRTIGLQRHELTAANRALRQRNEQLRQARHEIRLLTRVMRLKHEQKLEGIVQQIDRQLAGERDADAKVAG